MRSLLALLLLPALLSAGEFRITVLDAEGGPAGATLKVYDSGGKLLLALPDGTERQLFPSRFTFTVDPAKLPADPSVRLEVTGPGGRRTLTGLNGASQDVQDFRVRLPHK